MCRLVLKKTLNILDDLALCSDDNNIDTTFVGDIVYALQKSCNCLIIDA